LPDDVDDFAAGAGPDEGGGVCGCGRTMMERASMDR
jgi:hypothetical protein